MHAKRVALILQQLLIDDGYESIVVEHLPAVGLQIPLEERPACIVLKSTMRVLVGSRYEERPRLQRMLPLEGPYAYVRVPLHHFIFEDRLQLAFSKYEIYFEDEDNEESMVDYMRSCLAEAHIYLDLNAQKIEDTAIRYYAEEARYGHDSEFSGFLAEDESNKMEKILWQHGIRVG